MSECSKCLRNVSNDGDIPCPNCTELFALRKRVKELEVKIMACTNWDDACKELRESYEARIKSLELAVKWGEGQSAIDAIRLILPLAKGYAAEHPVRSNQAYVNAAEHTLEDWEPIMPSDLREKLGRVREAFQELLDYQAQHLDEWKKANESLALLSEILGG